MCLPEPINQFDNEVSADIHGSHTDSPLSSHAISSMFQKLIIVTLSYKFYINISFTEAKIQLYQH